MTRRLLAITAAVFMVSTASIFAGDQSQTLASRLAKEEQLLQGSTPITTAEVAQLRQLVSEIRATKNTNLISRGELLLTLFRERESSKAATQADTKSIEAEAKSIRTFRWQRTENVLEKSGLWTGLVSLGVLGISQAVKSWATNQFFGASTASAAAPYLVAGRVSEMTTAAGAIGAIGGIGMAWLLAINPFDIPSPGQAAPPVTFPSNKMTRNDKISYLETARKRYQQREQQAVRSRNVSNGFLAAGLTGLVAAGLGGYLSQLENQSVTSTSSSSSATYQSSATTYSYVTLGGAAMAFVGLTGAWLGYLFGPDPAQVERSIGMLDYQLTALRSQQ